MKLLLAALFCSVLALDLDPRSQGSGLSKPEPASIETRHLRVTTSASAAEVVAGGRLSLFVDLAPKPKMHVYAPGQQDYLGVSLTLEKDEAFAAGAAKFPASEKLFFKPLNETQRVYSHPFRITQPVTIARQRGGTVTVKGTLRYQACDDAVCYLPATVPLTWTVKIK
ncbi:MAG: hypothetical protein DMF86_17455 [Acidobacteria bacterium]|nr:MAG: hypothetical protein DMF86_17455 [Acidobacteriota bacterium]